MDGSLAPPAPAPALQRRRFTAADVQKMLDAGILTDRDKVELIGGELITMAPQGPLHWRATQRLVAWLFRHLPERWTVATQGPLRLTFEDEPEPDIFVFPVDMDVNDVRGRDVLVVIEVAVTSLGYDGSVKRDLYAREGVAHYWVIDLEGARTFEFRLGADGAYGAPEVVGFAARLEAGVLSLVVGDVV